MPYKDKEYHKKYYIKNKNERLEHQRQYRKNNPESVRKYGEKWRENNPEYHKIYYKENRKKILEKMEVQKKQWRKDNPEKVKKYNRRWRNKKYKTDLRFNLNEKMKSAIRISLKGNKGGKHWEDLVGYTLKDLIKRLKKTMPKGYTWQDYLDGRLEVDHKIPIKVFNFTKSGHIDFKRCWALKNLRLLPAEENRSKKDKLDKPFQPALKITFKEKKEFIKKDNIKLLGLLKYLKKEVIKRLKRKL